MCAFTYEKYRNSTISNENEINEILESWSQYIVEKHAHGKIPLIIAGAGVSANNVEASSVDKEKSNKPIVKKMEKGLPCLQEMLQELKDRLFQTNDINDVELVALKKQFEVMTDDMHNVDREWMGRVFTTFEKSENENIKKVWRDFCNWFFFSCMKSKDGQVFGALNVSTSEAAKQIAVMYDSVDAICLSANFDNFIRYAMLSIEGNEFGISIFERSQAEDYFKRNRRGRKGFEEKPLNRGVLHANGDVFWLSCSGEEGEGYCPNTKIRFPAFNSGKIKNAEDMKCEICHSPLIPTMTMPGTFEKDYNTRTIIETIWKYLSTRISGIITVGVSCNWDDILLKFILQLMSEMNIPLLDINNFSDKARNGKTQLVETVVKHSHLEAISINRDATEGLLLINGAINQSKNRMIEAEEAVDYKKGLIDALENQELVKRLSKVSQLGLKSFWLETNEKNERWSHSKEVADIAVSMYVRLSKNSRKKVSMRESILLYTAGLLHDSGHLPFSHLLEDVFEELSWSMDGENETFKHSHYTKWVIQQLYHDKKCKLKEFLNAYKIDVEEVIQLIEGKYGIAYMDALINSALDADKIAYIFTDAEKSRRNLALDKKEFLEKILEKTYITQEGLVAFDGESAWYAMRLLDERERMYKELYYDTRIRCLETMAKYIITTYFVQKYNDLEMLIHDTLVNERMEDLGNTHILNAIHDLYEMIDSSSYVGENLSDSVGENVKVAIKRCMQLILSAKRASDSYEPDEIRILQKMCEQLIGDNGNLMDENPEMENSMAYVPYRDAQLDSLTEKLSYEQLLSVRKKIMLNYPGTILIDVYRTTRYFSPSKHRAARNREDGTYCEQLTILIPEGSKDEWKTQENRASISLTEYAEKQKIDKKRKSIFHVFCIGKDMAECEHAISMLKKEMEHMRR